jgi:hypothetical protein
VATGYSIAQQADGKLVIAGFTDNYPHQWVTLRLNVDGSLDTTFGTAGAWVQTTSTDFSQAYSVSLYNDGTSEKIVIGGYTTRDGFDSNSYSTMIRTAIQRTSKAVLQMPSNWTRTFRFLMRS